MAHIAPVQFFCFFVDMVFRKDGHNFEETSISLSVGGGKSISF